MKQIGSYTNGSYQVYLFSDGTKIRVSPTDEFKPDFAESCDVTITKFCDSGCPFCYAGCSLEGKHADLFSNKFLKTLHPYTEMALNGNDLSHPQLDSFLNFLKEKKVITNITVNIRHFLLHYDKLFDWSKNGLIKGLGVSYDESYCNDEAIFKLQSFPNLVVHIINGIIKPNDIKKLSNKGLRLLILGYKTNGRGESYYDNNREIINKNSSWLKNNLIKIFTCFKVVSFDNLALSQLDVKSLITPEEWERIYMGDEGKFTFYIDLVSKTFAESSLSTKEFPIMDNIDDMFKFLNNFNQEDK